MTLARQLEATEDSSIASLRRLVTEGKATKQLKLLEARQASDDKRANRWTTHALDHTLRMSGPCTGFAHFLEKRAPMPLQTRLQQERYMVIDGDGRRRSCIVEKSSGRRWFEARRETLGGEHYRPTLHVTMDCCSKQFPGFQ